MKHFKVCLIAIAVIVALCALIIIQSKPISNRIIKYIDNNIVESEESDDEKETVEIVLSDFTHFEWDKVLIFQYPTSENDIEEAIGDEFKGSTDLTAGMIFVKDNKIVKYEYFDFSYEAPPKFFIYPFTDINNENKFRVFSKENAIFSAKVEKSNKRYYVLYPKDDNE